MYFYKSLWIGFRIASKNFFTLRLQCLVRHSLKNVVRLGVLYHVCGMGREFSFFITDRCVFTRTQNKF